jgi:SAP domain-containing new25/Domain of unknown function (DUF6434)
VRPPLKRGLSVVEFRRWYWMKHELVLFARQLGVSTAGDKPSLAARIESHLGGIDTSVLPRSRRLTVSGRLPEPLTVNTRLPPKQASSQQLKAWFREVIGPSFRFDIHMRTYISSNREKTLGDVVRHWHATRKAAKPETLPQLEYVRFTKAWHLANPDGTASACRAAWKRHKSLPIDERSL